MNVLRTQAAIRLTVASTTSKCSSGQTTSSTRWLHSSPVACKIQAGRYKPTRDRSKALTYEQAIRPEYIASRKGFNSINTAQLEGTFLEREAIGQDLPNKMFMEDLFIRKFMHGTWPEAIASEVIIKRQHNLVRIAGLVNRNIPQRKVYFLIGYTEELLSFWLKCPVKLELQTIESPDDVIFKYI